MKQRNAHSKSKAIDNPLNRVYTHIVNSFRFREL